MTQKDLKDFDIEDIELIEENFDRYETEMFGTFEEKVLATLQRIEAKIDNIETQTRKEIREKI